ncbi:MAG: 23S rRNA (adenine(2503)-C(2))-methyltransferase RlmN [Bacteroidota bacterium]
MKKKNLKGLTLKELEDFVEELEEPRYRGRQIFSWINGRGVKRFEEMSDISRGLRVRLAETATVSHLDVSRYQVSTLDGTTKLLFKLPDELMIESVLIPPDRNTLGAEKRLTVCISTQVGCPLGCKFCATGAMGYTRNLTPGEIVDQVIETRRHSTRRITNIVYMGMGEPLMNYENVMTSIEILMDKRCLGIGSRHVTVSTAGWAVNIRRLADENRKVKLAISLHTLNDQLRGQLMPITRKYPLNDLLDSVQYYYERTRLRPTFEYILFRGLNDTDRDVERLVSLAKRIPCKLNIIPFHSIDFMDPSGVAATLQPTSRERIGSFVETLRGHSVTVFVRSSAGEDINAACGQLAVKKEMLVRGTARMAVV